MKKNQNLIILAILSVSIIQMGTNAISPIMSDLAAAFPEAKASTVQFLMTFPSLMVILFGLLSGVSARYVPAKLLTCAGCCCFALSGILSWLFHGSLGLLFLWAAMMGIGIGVAVPVALSLVPQLIEGSRQQKVMGWVIGASNLGAMAMTFVGGLLATLHWYDNYLVYLIAAPGIFLTLLLLPGDRKTETAATSGQAKPAAEKAEKVEKAEKAGRVADLLKEPTLWASCAVALTSTMLFNTIPTNLAMLMTERGIGTALQAGTGTTLMLATGAVLGLLYGFLESKLGARVMVVAFGAIFAGQLLCAVAPNLPLLYLGCMLAGMSQGTNMAYVLMLAASRAHGNSALASSIVTAVSNLGGFVTPLLTMLAAALSGGSATTPRFYLSAGLALVIAIVILFVSARKAPVKAG